MLCTLFGNWPWLITARYAMVGCTLSLPSSGRWSLSINWYSWFWPIVRSHLDWSCERTCNHLSDHIRPTSLWILNEVTLINSGLYIQEPLYLTLYWPIRRQYFPCKYFIGKPTWSLLKNTSSEIRTSLFFTENSMIFWIVSALKIAPVGLPGLMMTIALGFLPYFLTCWILLSSYYKSNCHPFSSFK